MIETKALEEGHLPQVPSFQVKSCCVAFGTEDPKASGVWKVATAGGRQVPSVHPTWQ